MKLSCKKIYNNQYLSVALENKLCWFHVVKSKMKLPHEDVELICLAWLYNGIGN